MESTTNNSWRQLTDWKAGMSTHQVKKKRRKDNIVWGLSPERELCWSLVWIRLEPRVKTRPEVYTESAPDRWHSMRSQVGSNSKQLLSLSLSLGGLASRGERQRATFQRERRAAHRRARLKKKKRDLPSFSSLLTAGLLWAAFHRKRGKLYSQSAARKLAVRSRVLSCPCVVFLLYRVSLVLYTRITHTKLRTTSEFYSRWLKTSILTSEISKISVKVLYKISWNEAMLGWVAAVVGDHFISSYSFEFVSWSCSSRQTTTRWPSPCIPSTTNQSLINLSTIRWSIIIIITDPASRIC